jgi:hypothetical protein
MHAEPRKIPAHNQSTDADAERHIVKAWMLACHIDIDVATMIAEQHDQKTISAEQTVTALLSMASSGHYMNTYSQLFS